tara:strand:+ start:296 stop:850 length:555 start_codon:yes stop_codon:yes gene_type:complete
MTSFSKNNTLIVVALEDELPRKLVKDWRVIYTGIGKINAVIETSIAVEVQKPDFIVNFGTAGSSSENITGLHEVTLFKQRDMDLSPLGFDKGITPLDEIADISLGREGLSCGTGDNFVDGDQEVVTDLYDMEAYALAKFCLKKHINFYCFKFVSDQANEDAPKDWKDSVSYGAEFFIESVLLNG